jgi:hypothetical protein
LVSFLNHIDTPILRRLALHQAETNRTVKMCGNGKNANRPENNSFVVACLTKSERLLDERFADAESSRARIDQEPSKLSHFGRGPHNRDATHDFAVALGQPDALPIIGGSGKLGERTGDVLFEGVVESVFSGINTSVKLNDGANISGPEIGAIGHACI